MSGGAQTRFSVAGFEILLRSDADDGLDTLSGFYRHYPSCGGEPALIVHISRVNDFGDSRERGPEYPAFQRSLSDDGRIVVTRFDAEGEIALPTSDDEPVRASFTVGRSSNTLEAAIRISASIGLVRRGAFILHGSAIEAGGQAYVFAGVSGAGKSTIAAMLHDAFDAFTKISDELVILAPAGDGFRAHVTPFMGSDGLPHGASAPVAGLHFLVQAPAHKRIEMGHAAAMRELMHHILVYVAEPRTAGATLDLAARFAASVRCYRLEFAKNPAVAAVLGIT